MGDEKLNETNDEENSSENDVKEGNDNNANIDSKIMESLEKIRPYLNMEGGDVEYISFDKETGIVSVRLQGACSHCAISTVTLKMGIEKTLMEDIPEVKGVEQVE